MKNIYYLQKHLVKIGDVVEHNGFKVTVTEELIELNPELFSVEEDFSMDLWAYIPSIKKEPFKLGTQPMYFKCVKGECNYTKGKIYKQNYSTNYPIVISLTNDKGITENINYWKTTYIKHAYNCFELTTKEEWDKQELLDKAKRDYPAGTVFKTTYGTQKVLSDKPFMGKTMAGIVLISTDLFPRGGTIYTPEDGWSEILPLKFTTEDGVDIYGDMKTYMVPSNDSDITSCHGIWNGNSKAKCNKYFYHKENALAYIKRHEEKTLEDYEQMLSERGNSMICSSGVVYFSVYEWLKYNEPKLYYTKILQLIADDLNGDWEPDFNNEIQKKWFIDTLGVKAHCSVNYGLVYFKTSKLAEKARVILGDKLSVYLFN